MELKIALAGNPNSGKTTLFNALTGLNQFVGNWPGVTVEKKEGKLKKNSEVTFVDLPGIYSLSPYTMEEVVARNYLLGESPDAILNIVDGTNIERNLYLTTQLMETGIPVVVAINMMDAVKKRGDKLDTKGLSKKLGCTVVEISALKGENIQIAADEVIKIAKEKKYRVPSHLFSGEVEHTLAHIEEAVIHDMPEEKQRWYAIKIFERDKKVLDDLNIDPEVLLHIEEDIKKTEERLDDDAESIITNERYLYVERVLSGVLEKKDPDKLSVSDKIDKVVTNRIWALPIFALIMFSVYFISVTTVGTWATDWANDGLFGDGFYLFGSKVWVDGIPVLIAKGLNAINCWAWLESLILDGIVAGVGAVLGFVPQIFVLFILLSFLEACGYMSRIAFVLDKLFRKFGLSGKSFIPLLVGTGCSVPGIMASRTIENERDRRMTVISTSFIPCSAKLPFIALIASAIFGGAWWVAPLAYFIGIFAVILTGLFLKKTKMFSGEVAPFVMELPEYHMPTISSILRNTWERGWSFIKKAGTIILISSVLIWFLSYFGFKANGAFGMLSELEINRSLLSYVGRGIAWLFYPLGFGNWQSAVSTITGLVAKENIVGSLSILYGATGIGTAYTVASGLSFMIFNLLCAPCFAAMGAIKREMNSAKWTAFAITYQCVLAYFSSFVVYHLTLLFSGLVVGFWGVLQVVLAFIALIAVITFIVYPKKKNIK